MVWTSFDKNNVNKIKYEKTWNPFHILSKVYDKEGWDPSENRIIKEVKSFINKGGI